MCVCVCLECCLSVSACFFSNPFLHLEVVAPLVLASGSFVFFFYSFRYNTEGALTLTTSVRKGSSPKRETKVQWRKSYFFSLCSLPSVILSKTQRSHRLDSQRYFPFFFGTVMFLFCYFSNYGKYSSTKTWVILERDTSVIPVNVIFLLLPGCFECQKRGQHFFFLLSPQSDSPPIFFCTLFSWGLKMALTIVLIKKWHLSSLG